VRTRAVGGFTGFYESHYAGTARLAYLLTQSDLAYEDLVQEAFTKLHVRFDDLERPAAYLRVTIVNLCRQWHRSEGRRARRNELLAPIVGDVAPDVAEVLEAVSQLPYRQRAVVVLRYWAGWSEAEIAEALSCRPGTVKSSAARALSRLRTELEA
jgi:DNA-directed RNA polymerase specialized sigma24 family protein